MFENQEKSLILQQTLRAKRAMFHTFENMAEIALRRSFKTKNETFFGDFQTLWKHWKNPHFLCKYVVYFPGSATFVLLLPILQHYGRLESNWIPAFFSRFSIVIGNTNYRNSFSFWLRKGRSRSWYAEVLKSSSSMSVTVCATIPKSLSSKM